MKTKDILKAIEPYCDRIVFNGKHYKAYPKGSNNVIVISSTSAFVNRHKEVFRDFRRNVIIIDELK